MYPTPELEKQFREAQDKAAKTYPYKSGDLFLGYVLDKAGNPVEIGIPTKRHAITMAGARSGKGVGIIIPNLRRWPHNALVIDPKGEAAEATAEAREAMGQAVHVLDPFHVADVPERFRARFNPLAKLDANSRTIREDINVLADGLVMRADARAAHWDGGTLSVIAGLIAQVVDTAPPELRTLPEIRRLLTSTPEAFNKLIAEMSTNGACGNLPATAAARLQRSGSEAGHFLSGADENTKWLDSTAIGELLEDSTFDLSDLKTKPCTVYLVLPAHLLGEHGRFLRLFVRAALDAMAKGGTKGGHQCLFLLDEFYSLGRIDEIAKAAGLMPGYGVKLWPILQDLNQLVQLYDRDGAGTFFGNADLHQFFGNTDQQTLEHISHRLGAVSLEEIPLPPSAPMNVGGGPSMLAAMSAHSKDANIRGAGAAWGALSGGIGALANAADAADYQNQMNDYQRHMSRLGKPRIPPDEVAALVQLKGDVVADGSLAFVYGSEKIYSHLAPYFRDLPPPPPPPPSFLERLRGKHADYKRTANKRMMWAVGSYILWGGLAGLIFQSKEVGNLVGIVAGILGFIMMSL